MGGLRVSDVSHANLELELAGYDRLEEPTFGVGSTFLGPALFATLTAQWFAADWLVTELGFWVGPHFDGFAGFRVRPGPRTSPRLWLGAAYGSYCHRQPLETPIRADATGTTDAEQPEDLICDNAATLRLGADISFGRGHWQLSPEVDLLIPTDSNSAPEVSPWGGVTATRLF